MFADASDLSLHDFCDALAALLTSKDEQIDRLERLVAASTVDDLRYRVHAERSTIGLYCTEHRLVVDEWPVYAGPAQIAAGMRRHNREHDDGAGVVPTLLGAVEAVGGHA
jgi:hypothetical protein